MYAALGAGRFFFGEATMGILWSLAFLGNGVGLASMLPVAAGGSQP